MSEGLVDWTTDPFQVPEVAGRTPQLHLPKKASDRNGTNSYSGMCGMALIIAAEDEAAVYVGYRIICIR